MAQVILRVSNCEQEGFRGVGREGWHIDGVTYDVPFSHSLYHIVHPGENVATHFLSLRCCAHQSQQSQQSLQQSATAATAVTHPLPQQSPTTAQWSATRTPVINHQPLLPHGHPCLQPAGSESPTTAATVTYYCSVQQSPAIAAADTNHRHTSHQPLPQQSPTLSQQSPSAAAS